jgi:hypothetical protein
MAMKKTPITTQATTTTPKEIGVSDGDGQVSVVAGENGDGSFERAQNGGTEKRFSSHHHRKRLHRENASFCSK